MKTLLIFWKLRNQIHCPGSVGRLVSSYIQIQSFDTNNTKSRVRMDQNKKTKLDFEMANNTSYKHPSTVYIIKILQNFKVPFHEQN
jgi:hypothetical protein